MEHVNHPQHYNSHPNGIECIDIIRHYVCDIANAIKYLWRAGLKSEMGMEDAEKEIEDLKKAIFYIEDYKQNMHPKKVYNLFYSKEITLDERVKKVTGYDMFDIISPYIEEIGKAMRILLHIGIIDEGLLYESENRDAALDDAIKYIQKRIINIRH